MPTGPVPINTNPTLLDLVRKIDPMKLPVIADLRSPSWQLPQLTQAQSRVNRSNHLQPSIHFIAPSPTFDLKALDAMRKKIDDSITAQMLGKSMAPPLRYRDRREHPDYTAGLYEAMREDEAEFGTIIVDQQNYDPAMINRWIWGPNGEFTGYPAGDPAFEDTVQEIMHREHGRGPVVASLREFERITVEFRFTPRFSRYDAYKDPHRFDYYRQGPSRGRPTIPVMIQFDTYAAQHEWASLARYAAQQEMKISPTGRMHRAY